MGRVVARTPAQVVAGEAVAGTRAQRYDNKPTPGFFGSLFGGLLGGAPKDTGYGYGVGGGNVGNGYAGRKDPWSGLREVTGGSRGGGIGPGGSGPRDPSS